MNRQRKAWPSVVMLVASLGWCVCTNAQARQFEEVGKIAGPANSIRVQGNFVVTVADKVISVFDISNLASAQKLGDYTFPDSVLGVQISGSFVYVAANLYGLGILAVTNSGPKLRGTFKTPGSAKSVALSGSLAIVADQVSGLDLIDTSNPTNLVSVGSVYLDGFASDVTTAGSFAFAVDRPNGFYVVDLSKPKTDEPMSSLRSSASFNGGMQVEVIRDSAGRPATAIRAPGQLLLYDVSNPARPVEKGLLRTPGRPARVAVNGTTVYVADGPEGVEAFDMSMPTEPRILATYKTASPAIDVSVSGTLVFVVTRASGVVVLRETRPQ